MPLVDRPPRRRLRRPLLVLASLLAVVVAATGCMPPLVEPPTSGRNFGQGPLEAIYEAASEKAACGLTPVELAAMMMTPTYGEAGGPVPSPMALSRWDNVSVSSTNANLFAFGKTSGAYVNAFFSPGIGMWQFDSAGGWPFSAAGAIDSVTAAQQAATTMSYRWCNAPSGQQVDAPTRRKYAWGPWFSCTTGTTCESIFQSLVAGDKLNTAFDPSTTRYGGMQQRTCNVEGLGERLTCWYVNPALAEGSKGWTAGTYNGTSSGVTPLPKPFYVIEANNREYRIWISEDTGYDIGITASKPITANARTSLTWTATAALCDVTASRGECVGGADPTGSFDAVVAAAPNTLWVGGWALDPDTTAPIAVHIYVDGVGTVANANLSRPDVGSAHPGYGDLHGFSAYVAASPGPHEVCVHAINVKGGANVLLGCKDVTVTGTPTGSLDVATARPGSIVVGGWVAVPYAPGAKAVLSVDGAKVAEIDPNVQRPDVQALVPSAGSLTGFNATLTASGGTRRVCLSTTGQALGALGCRTVTLPSGSPFGTLDVAVATAGGVRVGGWAIDPDTSASIPVHVYADSSGVAILADSVRPDVAAAYNGYGERHGYSGLVPSAPGTRQVCAYGINTGVGANALFGCRSVTVLAGSPFGSLDAVTRVSGGVRVAGWAIDPDTVQATQVHVYVGSNGSALPASQSRSDLGVVFPGYGADHGFTGVVPAPGTPVSVCAYAIDVAGTGTNVLLGCRTV